MTPKDLINTCRNTAAQMPKGATIADTVERLLRERNDLAYALRLALPLLPNETVLASCRSSAVRTSDLLDLVEIRTVASKYGVDLGA